MHKNEDTVFSILLILTLNGFIFETGDLDRMAINPDLLGKGVKIVQGGVIVNQIFDFFAQYVQKVHSDEFIHKCLRYAPWRSYLDIIGLCLHCYSYHEHQGHVGSGHKNVRVGGTGCWQSREEIATTVHK